MEPEIIICSIGNSWSPKAIGLILPIQQSEFHLPVTIDGQPDLLDIDRFYHRPGGGFWAAVDGGRLIGTIGLLAIGNNTGVIRKLFVHEEYRGKQWGVAQRLLDTLKAFCLSAGIRDIYLGTIDTMKAAARFYERNGFRGIPKSQLPAIFPLLPVDNTFYHLDLPHASAGKNTIDRTGILAIATRLLRLSEQLRKDAGEIYEMAGIPFEPKWFPVIYVLDRKTPRTVMEIAGEIGYTHPSTISLLQQLEKGRLVRSARDKTDSRKRLVHLTPKGQELISRMKPVWHQMTVALTDLTDTAHPLLPALDEIEQRLQKESFLERTRRLL
jgi:DNA-binding MarR family transcriptional regulator/GNAT superfamily N-acetyltransferase